MAAHCRFEPFQSLSRSRKRHSAFTPPPADRLVAKRASRGRALTFWPARAPSQIPIYANGKRKNCRLSSIRLGPPAIGKKRRERRPALRRLSARSAPRAPADSGFPARDLGGGLSIARRSCGVSSICGGAEVLLEAMQLGRAGNRHDPRLLAQQPGERDLRRRRLLAPISVKRSTSALFALRASGVKRGKMLRKSVAVERRVLVDLRRSESPCRAG